MFIKSDIETEKVKNIRQFEEKFSDLIKDISLLGQLDLSKKELLHITGLIRENIDMLKTTSSYFKKEAPITFSLFLLYTGLKEYQEGDFWAPIYDRLNLKKESSKWNSIFGAVFYYTLQEYNLKQFEAGRNKYVNQILAHGMIADNYLEEFFEDFLYKEFGNFLDISFTLQDIEKRIINIRRDHEGHQKLLQELARIEKEKEKMTTKITVYELAYANYDNLRQLNILLDNKLNIRQVDELLELPENYLEERSGEIKELESKIETCKKQINKIESRENEIELLLEKYKKIEQKIKDKEKKEESLQAKIRRSGGELLNRPWQKDDLNIVKKIPLDKLASMLKEYKKKHNYQERKTSLKGLLKYIIFLFRQKYLTVSGLNEKRKAEIRSLLNGLPLKMSLLKKLPIKIYDELKTIEDCFKEIEEINKSIKNYKQSISSLQKEMAAVLPENEIDFFNGKEELAAEKEKQEDNLTSLKKQKDSTLDEIKNYKMKLNIISGDGGVESGLDILKGQREYRKQITQLKKIIEIKGNKLDRLRGIVADREKKEIRKLLTHMKANLKTKQKNIEEHRKELEAYPERLYSLIESTRIFLFQGEKIAVKFVYNCLIYLQMLQNKKISKNESAEIILPKRISTELENWWSEFTAELRKSKNRDSRKDVYSRNPYLQFSFEKRELDIFIPEQKIKRPENRDIKKPFLVLKDKKGKIIRKLTLDLFNLREGLLKTEAKNIAFPRAQKNIFLKVTFADEVIIESKIKKKPFYFLKKGKVSAMNPLNYNQVELVLKNNFTIEPEEIVIQEQEMSGNWSDYTYYHLNSSEFDILNILNQQRTIIESYTRNKYLEPQLSGGEVSKHFSSDQTKVYTEKMPRILITPESLEKLRLWQLRISNNKSQKIVNINLNEVEDELDIFKNLVQILLSHFSGNRYGRYDISLKRRGPYAKEWKFSYVLLPEIKVIFNKKIYSPAADNEQETGQVEFVLPGACSIKSEQGELINEKNRGIICLRFNPGIRYLKCRFISKIKENNFEIQLLLKIPVVGWQLKGSEINSAVETKIKEIWYEDIFNQEEAYLEINLPAGINYRRGVLILNDFEQQIYSKIAGNTCEYNLMKFSDNIKSNVKPVQKIYFKIDLDYGNQDKRLYHLLDIRTKWEIIDLDIDDKHENDDCILDLKWKQKGKDNGKRIIIWHQETGEKVLSQKITDAREEMLIKGKRDKLSPGRYLLQFKEIDLWSTEKLEIPSPGMLNTFELLIGQKDDLIKEMKKYGLIVVAVEDEENNRHPLQDNYQITGIKEAAELEFPGEERYEGQLLIFTNTNGLLSLARMEMNPVSFYFDIEDISLPFLVDKQKDGFTFCKKCRRLFWETIDKKHPESEHYNYHILPRKFYVKINRSKGVDINGSQSSGDN